MIPTLRDAAQQALDDLEDAAEEWSRYVVEDTAHCTLLKHLEPHINALRAALAEQQGPVKATPYNLKRIAWELERTAVGDGFYGNALRVAKDMPGITPKDRSVLDRYATGTQTGADHVHLQWLAQWLYNKDERAPEAPQLKAEQPAEQESVQDEYNRVINHAIEQGIEASVFLHCWRAGDWSGCAEFGFEPNMAAYTAPQPAKPAEQPQEPSAGGVLFAVEQAIRNGDCPWQIEQAFDEYEVERRNSIKE